MKRRSQELEIHSRLRYLCKMEILGIDFTSRPSRRKPITCSRCTFNDDSLRFGSLEKWDTFSFFDLALAARGPWIAGIDFPFGQSRKFVESIGWPATSWEEYVRFAATLGRIGFREALNSYKQNRAAKDKEHSRATDKLAGSVSPQKLYGVPVALMFFEGAPRILKSGATIANLLDGDRDRIIVEAYPGVLARRFVGRRSYKSDTPKKQTKDQRAARFDLLQALRRKVLTYYGFSIEVSDALCEDPSGDELDAFLCAVQAAWAWQHRRARFGAPENVDKLEGWISDPSL